MADFMARLDEINALAERSPGFVWRLQGDSGNDTDYGSPTAIPLFIVNLTVWRRSTTCARSPTAPTTGRCSPRRFEWFERRSGPTR